MLRGQCATLGTNLLGSVTTAVWIIVCFYFFIYQTHFVNQSYSFPCCFMFDSPSDSQINSLSCQLAVFTGVASCINKNHVGVVVALAERS